METAKLPRLILEKAVQLRDPLKKKYLALYSLHKPATAKEVGELTNTSRARTSVCLNQLADMGFLLRYNKGHKVLFEIKEVKDAHDLLAEEEEEGDS